MEGGYAASWKKSKYEYVKGTIELVPPTLSWAPLKESQADTLEIPVASITGRYWVAVARGLWTAVSSDRAATATLLALVQRVGFKEATELRLTELGRGGERADLKKTKKGAPTALLRVDTADHGNLSFDFVEEEQRDELHTRLQSTMDGVEVLLEDGSTATAAEVKAAAIKNFVAQVNEGGWGDAPEHLLCGLFRASLHLRTPAQSRVIRAVCKRWRVAHDSVMDKLKPGRWWEGKRHLPLTEGDSAAEEAGAPPSWAAAPPTVMSLLERFHKLTSIDFSSAEVKNRVSDVTARVLGACAAPVASLNLAHCVHITHVGVAALAPLKSTLTALDLTGCFRVGDDGVDAVLRLTELRELSLAETSKVTDDGLAHLATGVRLAATLTALDLHECREVSSAGLRTLQSLTSLRKLDVSDMRRVDAEGVSALAALPWLTELRMCGSHAVAAGEGSLDTLMDSSENLVRVDLEWCFAMGESEVQALAATRSPLAQLSFKGCGALVDAAMFPLAAVTSLGAVDLTWCSQVGDDGLRALTELRHTLTTLTLKGCERITDDGLEMLAQCPHLTALDVSGCAEVTGTGLEALAPVGVLLSLNVGMLRRMDGEGMAAVGTLASLTSLSINASTAVTAENVAKITGLRALATLSLAECPLLMDDVPAELALLVFSLTSLDLSYNQRLGDRGVKELAALANLRQLSLHSCTRISNQCMGPLSRLRKLEGLAIGQCRGVTAEGLAFLAAAQPNLVELDISGVCTTLNEETLRTLPPWVQLIRRVPVHDEKPREDDA